ncbi:MAG: NusG domain II-containing protein [Firmicutes bacterium]|nr:NusG domain II-containing protein [Bacillota bacterium]
MNKYHRNWQNRYFKPGDLIIYTVLIAIFALGTAITVSGNKTAASVAVVTSDGQEVHRVDLKKVKAPYEFTVELGGGHYNTIRVENGRIRVIEASCPDQIDVKQGWISLPYQSIICLPNRLLINILPAQDEVEEIDGIAF